MTAPPRSTLRLYLVRHGRPAHDARGWLDAAGLRAWFDAYDAAGLAASDAPPPPLVALAEAGGLIVASDLPRALASAERLAGDLPVACSPLLRETPVPLPDWSAVRLPLAAWALAAGVRAGVGRLRGMPAPVATRRQAASAASWLVSLAEAHGSVVAVTHAAVRGHIAAALRQAGWTHAPGRRGFGHWSVWGLERAATAAARAPASGVAPGVAPGAAPARPAPLRV